MYAMRRIVLGKKPHQYRKYFGKTAEECSADIRREILRGIVATARWLDADVGHDASALLERRIPPEEFLMLDILEGQEVPIEIKNGIRGNAFKNVVFCTNLQLDGPWAAGKLRSRGYGLIRRRIDR